MLTGVDTPLPPTIAEGLTDVSKRKSWNGPAPAEVALPTETWREHVARRQRCLEIRAKLKAGEIHDINDLITLNLDICQFAEDVIENCEGSDLLLAFWKAIQTVSVLDPTCGSGAFLFAALNILEPLYEACLERMHGFLEDLEQSKRKHHPATFDVFRKVLQEANDTKRHPSHRYFVRKSIVLNNLYGVDIMEEAVEICKLRLFLNLIAQVDRGQPIEALPDIDFNIRPGNTLVGFASLDEVRRSLLKPANKSEAYAPMPGMEESEEVQEIITAAKYVDDAFRMFHEVQSVMGLSGSALTKKKQDLRQKLDDLDAKLDHYIAGEYGVDPKKPQFTAWKSSHQPFHWFAEFYGIMTGGGFNIIIGNPPYIELAVLSTYQLVGFDCTEAGNLYAVVLERCADLCSSNGRQGFIVPVSSVSTDRYKPLQNLLTSRQLHYSSFDDRPSRLFDGLEHIRLTIHVIGNEAPSPVLKSTRYNKWNSDERANLFNVLKYAPAQCTLVKGTLPKLTSEIESAIAEKLVAEKATLSAFYSKVERHRIFYSRKVGYFLQILDFEPKVLDGAGNRRPPSEFKELRFSKEAHAKLALCCLNSNLFYWFVTVFSDCRHVNKREVDAFPVDLEKLAISPLCARLVRLAKELMDDLKVNSEERRMKFRHDDLTVQCIVPKKSKKIIDEIDRVLAKHYGFTDEELDFIINYETKYRLGQENAGAEAEE